MAHRLEGHLPLTATLRYRCGCTGGEVIQIGVSCVPQMSEAEFIDTMRLMWQDMQIEIRQHTNQRPPPRRPERMTRGLDFVG